jgi:predicted nucleic acid-binding protein
MIYLDSNIIIYLIEQPAGFGPRAMARVQQMQLQGDEIVVSDLTRLECRHFPLSQGNLTAVGQYNAFFHDPAIRVVPLTASVCDRATDVRARRRFTTIDALHLAAAMESGCDRFLTNDRRLAGFSDLQVEILP